MESENFLRGRDEQLDPRIQRRKYGNYLGAREKNSSTPGGIVIFVFFYSPICRILYFKTKIISILVCLEIIRVTHDIF
jgi:hypothetical protein